MIDTVEAGAGSYPEPDESQYKDYEFEFIGSYKGYGIVQAKDEESARELIMNGDYDDIIDTYSHTIEEITRICEE